MERRQSKFVDGNKMLYIGNKSERNVVGVIFYKLMKTKIVVNNTYSLQ